MNGQDDKTKKLLVKVQRLQQTLSKGSNTSKSPVKKDTELENLVDSLRSQLGSLQKTTSSLRTKAQYWKSLHEVETRKRNPYDYIQPRIRSTQPSVKRLVPASSSPVRPRGGLVRADSSGADLTPESEAAVNEIGKLQDLVSMLRTKLAASDQELERLRAELERSRSEVDSSGAKGDLDKITLQRELAIARKRAADSEALVSGLEAQTKTLMDAHAEALQTVQEANDQLKAERRRNQQLEELLRHAEMAKQGEKGLLQIIEELQKEKRTLQEELAKLVDLASNSQLNFLAEDEELAKLRDQLLSMEAKWKAAESLAEQYLGEKRELLDRMSKMLDELNAARMANKSLQGEYESLKRRFEDLEEQLRWIKHGPIPWAEIEEALAFLKARRAKGQKDGFSNMVDLDELEEYKKLLEQVRTEYSECFDDLARTQRLLEVEQALTKELKAELERLKRQLESMKNEYEMRLEEDARLLDLRNHRIAMLEAQLNSLAIGGERKEPAAFVAAAEADDEFDDPPLRPGENILDTVMVRAHFSREGIEVLRLKHLDQFVNAETPQNLLSFATFDFFDFATAVSTLGLGENPEFSFQARYRFFVNDFLMHYLQTRKGVVNICCCSGVEWVKVACANVLFSDIVQPGQTDKLIYYLDMYSPEDERVLLGKLELSLSVRIAMTQAIRAYKERTIALNLLTVTDDELTRNRFLSRCPSNTLIIQVSVCQNLRAYAGIKPAVFLAMQFYDFSPITSETVRDSLSPSFNLRHRLDVKASSHLDQYLRTQDLEIFVLDDSAQFEGDFCYGKATIPLVKLLTQSSVAGQYDIRTPKNLYGGTIAVQLSWQQPYSSDVEPKILEELRGEPQGVDAAPAENSASNRVKPNDAPKSSKSDAELSDSVEPATLGSQAKSLASEISLRNSSHTQVHPNVDRDAGDQRILAEPVSALPQAQNLAFVSTESVSSVGLETSPSDLAALYDVETKASSAKSNALNGTVSVQVEPKASAEQPTLPTEKSVLRTSEVALTTASRSSSLLSVPSAVAEADNNSRESLTENGGGNKLAARHVASLASLESAIQVSEISDVGTPKSALSSQSSTQDVGLYSNDKGERVGSSADHAEDNFVVGINSLQFALGNPAAVSLLEGVAQLFVCFDFADCDPETLETHSLPLRLPSTPKLVSLSNSQTSLESSPSTELTSSKLHLANLKSTVTATTSKYQRRRTSLAADTVLQFNFKRSIQLSSATKEQAATRDILAKKLTSEDPLENSLFFSIVSEPPSDPTLSAPTPKYASECVDVGIAQINLKHWVKKQQQSEKKSSSSLEILPVYDLTGNIQLGSLNVTLEGLSTLESVIRSASH